MLAGVESLAGISPSQSDDSVVERIGGEVLSKVSLKIRRKEVVSPSEKNPKQGKCVREASASVKLEMLGTRIIPPKRFEAFLS